VTGDLLAGLVRQESVGPDYARGMVHRRAWLSPDGTYRYLLSRTWQDRAALEPVWWIMLNPSTADGVTDDQTISKCLGYAWRWGYGGIRVVNLFSLRATDPAELRRHPDPVGPLTDPLLEYLFAGDGPAPPVVCAWGAQGRLRGRGRRVTTLLRGWRVDPVCLGVTGDRQPVHPARLSYQRDRRRWPTWEVAVAWHLRLAAASDPSPVRIPAGIPAGGVSDPASAAGSAGVVAPPGAAAAGGGAPPAAGAAGLW
jgi:hypothetical protein